MLNYRFCFFQILSAHLNLNRGVVPFDIDRTALINDHCLDAVALKLVADAFCSLHIFAFSGYDKCIFIFPGLSFLVLLN